MTSYDYMDYRNLHRLIGRPKRCFDRLDKRRRGRREFESDQVPRWAAFANDLSQVSNVCIDGDFLSLNQQTERFGGLQRKGQRRLNECAGLADVEEARCFGQFERSPEPSDHLHPNTGSPIAEGTHH